MSEEQRDKSYRIETEQGGYIEGQALDGEVARGESAKEIWIQVYSLAGTVEEVRRNMTTSILGSALLDACVFLWDQCLDEGLGGENSPEKEEYDRVATLLARCGVTAEELAEKRGER